MAEEMNAGAPLGEAAPRPAATDPKGAIIDALMELAGERSWEDITMSDIAIRANVSLSVFRDHFPSKGAVLAGFSRRIDKTVLDATGDDLIAEASKERCLMC